MPRIERLEQNTPEWLRWRMEGIGSSDAPVIMGEGAFKPNCALVVLEFLVRHGILTAENEPDYVEIVARLHRRLEFPTA